MLPDVKNIPDTNKEAAGKQTTLFPILKSLHHIELISHHGNKPMHLLFIVHVISSKVQSGFKVMMRERGLLVWLAISTLDRLLDF